MFPTTLVISVHRVFYIVSQVLDPRQRLGCEELGGYPPLKAHVFLHDVPWGALDTTKPPVLLPYLPAKSENAENFWGGTVSLIIQNYLNLSPV